MTRELAASTLEKFRERLEGERSRLEQVIADHDEERETSRLAEGSADRSADADNVDGGAIAVELEMDLTMVQNARDLLIRVRHALERMEKGLYGICEITGEPIPIERLEALPYATTTVEAASRL